MHQKKVPLASDNWAPVHPSVLESIVGANDGVSPPYGIDHWTIEAQRLIQEAFKSECRIFFVPTGTGANVYALKLTCKSHESIICSDIAHIHYQESGAAESVIGCKLLTVPSLGGKLSPSYIMKILNRERAFGKHSTSPRVLSIAQPTEVGTVYTLAELRALSKLCKTEGLLLHIDGSRFYNAVVALKYDFHEIIEAAQADLLSLGGTKNGAMSAEALLIFNPTLNVGADHLQKQTLQLLSKMRYLSAQFIALFKNNLWQTLAKQANQKAHEMASIILSYRELALSYAVETNQVFFTAPTEWISHIQERIACLLWEVDKNEIRLIASWNTCSQDLLDLKSTLEGVAAKYPLPINRA